MIGSLMLTKEQEQYLNILKTKIKPSERLVQQILKSGNINESDYTSRTLLHYAAMLGDVAMINCFLQAMTDEAVLARNSSESTALQEATSSNKTEAVLRLLQDQRFKNSLYNEDIYGRIALKIALQNKNDKNIEILYKAMNIDPAALSPEPPFKDLNQMELIDVLTRYLNLMGRKGEEIVDQRGNCNGISFLYQIYLPDREQEFWDIESFISDIHFSGIKEKDLELLTNLTLPDSLSKKYKNVGELLDQFVNDISIFHLGSNIAKELALGLTQKSRVELYELVKDEAVNRQLKKLFRFDSLNLNQAQLAEMLNLLSTWRGTSIDIDTSHNVTLYITPEGKFNYFDTNLKNKVKDLNNQELAEHMFKANFNLSAEKKLLKNDTTMISFQVHMFYKKLEDIPVGEQAVSPLSYPTSTISPCGFTKLHYAVIQNDLNAAKKLIEEGYDLNADDSFGFTPLMWAARIGNESMVKLLIEKKATIEKYLTDKSALFYAASHGNEKIVQYLIDHGADVNFRDDNGMNALHWAIARKGGAKVVKMLLDMGAEINVTDKDGLSVLHYAAMSDDSDTAKVLIDYGADFNKKSFLDNSTPLLFAVKNGSEKVVKTFLEKKGVKDTEKNTALDLAVKGGHSTILKLLIDKIGPENLKEVDYERLMALLDITVYNKKDKEVMMVLLEYNPKAITKFKDILFHWACRCGYPDLLELIASKTKLNMSQRFPSGDSPLTSAIKSKSLETVEWLINKGASVQEFADSNTPLMWAIKTKNLKAFNLVLSRKNNKANEAVFGVFPIHLAAQSGQLNMVQSLLEAKVDINSINKNGMTALMFAASEGHLNVVKLLLEQGANVDNTNKQGKSALDLAIAAGHYQLAVELIIKGAKMTDLQMADINKMLSFAAQVGENEVIEMLVLSTARMNELSINDTNPLLWAVNAGNKELIETFLTLGVSNIEIMDDAFTTPLLFAVQNRNKEVVKLIIENGANINHQDVLGMTALHWAVSNSDIELVNLLLDKGALIDLADDSNVTPLMMAAQAGNEEIVNLLVNKGANVDVVDINNLSAVDYATSGGFSKIANSLQENIDKKHKPLSLAAEIRESRKHVLHRSGSLKASSETLTRKVQDKLDTSKKMPRK